MVKLLKYSQSTGFTQADFDDYEGEGTTWLANAGFETSPILDDGKNPGYKFSVYRRLPSSELHAHKFVAILEDPNFTQTILVNAEPDLLALRLAVAPLLVIS